jgi:hypothetical protein
LPADADADADADAAIDYFDLSSSQQHLMMMISPYLQLQ